MAYLVDRGGAAANTNELCAVLWADNGESFNVKVYLRRLLSDLTKTLKKANADCIFHKKRNSFAVLPDKFKCDLYDFEKCDTDSVNAYLGEYMVQYSWAEMTAGALTKRVMMNN